MSIINRISSESHQIPNSNALQYREKLDGLAFRTGRESDYLAFAKEEYAACVRGFDLANDRMDKVAGTSVLVLGWFISSKPASASFLTVLAFACLFAAVAFVLWTRWRVEGRSPQSFPEFVLSGNDPANRDKSQWEFSQARQYAFAAARTQQDTHRVHIKLLVSILLLLVGLACLAISRA